ncbi:AAA family ATPase [archaeon]|nr:MAG: AAA family ATPase [archaeon]
MCHLLQGAILFIDEADAAFPSRTRYESGNLSVVQDHLLSQLLKFMEGMHGTSNTTLVFATNRASALDAALVSRCASTISFDLPDDAARRDILRLYAKHLPPDAIASLAHASSGFSGRDVKRVCEGVERRHAAAIVRESASRDSAPSADAYTVAVRERRAHAAARRSDLPVATGPPECDV